MSTVQTTSGFDKRDCFDSVAAVSGTDNVNNTESDPFNKCRHLTESCTGQGLKHPQSSSSSTFDNRRVCDTSRRKMQGKCTERESLL